MLPTWYVEFSNTSGNAPEGPNPGSSRSRWKAFYEDVPKYKVKPVSHYWTHPPTHTLDLQNPYTIYDFMNQFHAAFPETTWTLESTTLLFGVDTVSGSDLEVYGFTWGRFDNRPCDLKNGVSFVYRGAITRISNMTVEQQWDLTTYAVLHELGHARGLVGNGGENFDHNYHGSSADADTCVMNLPTPPLSFVPKLCDFHRRVLAQCLTEVKGAYSTADDCARYWQ